MKEMSKRFKKMNVNEEAILLKAIRAWESEKNEATFHSLTTLIDRILESYGTFYQRHEFNVRKTVYDPDTVDAWINLALDLKNEELFREFAKLKQKVSGAPIGTDNIAACTE